MQGKDIFRYAPTKQKYATSSSMKKPFFKAAIDQIEAALQGDDPAPNSYEVLFCFFFCLKFEYNNDFVLKIFQIDNILFYIFLDSIR